MNIANRFQKLFLLVLAFASIATFAPTAAAKKSYAPPEIENFSVTPEYLFPGAELDFTVEGTPHAKASVRISGINRTIPLREVAEGVLRRQLYNQAHRSSGRQQHPARDT